MLKTTLRILHFANWINWAFGALFVFFIVFLAMGSGDLTTRLAEELTDQAAVEAAYFWLVGLAVLSLPIVLLTHVMLTRIIAIVASAQADAAFTDVNADRFKVIAWALLAINIIDLAFGILSHWVSERSGEYFGWSLSITGWFAVLLLFVLARIFRHGARMQADLEGTV